MPSIDAGAVLDAGLVDTQGRPTTLRARLQGDRTAVVFLRHYG